MTDNTSSAGSDADDWAAALAEQTAASAAPAPAPAVAPATAQVFQQIQDTSAAAAAAAAAATTPVDIARVLDVPVQLTAEIGRTRITIKNLLQLSQGSVVELDGLAGQPLDVLINGYLIAQGEVVVVNEKYGIRLTDIVTPSERMQKLARA
ncbi:flagellar motor switch protein FliN [Variovorax sp. NFACC27]|uniref:Flagellar motor switch protein FliN n=1 Tax=Variovorax gossypii TaxID=1679495 RepID=A0A431TIH7_9BURK|nr:MULTISPECIES: flagellar motor switch protein FliN [Variovorax]MDP9604077.1 flagellar motor switch protein FliN/FliY [Variovorax paradoxus]SEF26881.1 flagellar motor switch protein FliN/FliY [Variovorax sp. NFACC28]SEG61920.1 flagellar motor switch protein FliN/FliY [Variovorax sp. NFACC29]SFC62618.1 flagellar motor switch protein FliN/FliY [Variovorax sp. NFACC26]SFG68791.1 flagellar motor switch protein FliN/FliY [Variovorax sp. NFACC27]